MNQLSCELFLSRSPLVHSFCESSALVATICPVYTEFKDINDICTYALIVRGGGKSFNCIE